MPRKKTAVASGEASVSSGKIVWNSANDNKLLLLTQGRHVLPEEYDRLASAFASGSKDAIRNRVSALRLKQRKLYEDLHWALPEGGAKHSTKKARCGKRNAEEVVDEDEDDLVLRTPSKKPRTKRVTKKLLKYESDDDDDDLSYGAASTATTVDVKQEQDEEYEQEEYEDEM